MQPHVHRSAEISPSVDRLTVLSRANGNLEDYDHNSMLLSKQAPADHFPALVEWMR